LAAADVPAISVLVLHFSVPILALVVTNDFVFSLVMD